MRLQACLTHLVFYWIMFCPGYHLHQNFIGYITRSFGFIFSHIENDVTTIHPCVFYEKTS